MWFGVPLNVSNMPDKIRDDKISQPRIDTLHPFIRNEVKETIIKIEAGFSPQIAVRIVQALRTFAEQDELYSHGRNGDTRPRVTNSRSGQSFHNYGLALDFALLYDKDNNGSFEALSWDILRDFDKDGESDWQEVVAKFEDKNYAWGGHWAKFSDNPHLEKTFGHTWQDLLKKYNDKQFIPGGKYLIL